MGSENDRQNMVFGLALASAVSQIGCVTLVIVLGALGVGLWLDDLFNARPLFTIVLILASVPVSMYILVRIALSAAAKVTPPPKPSEDQPSGKTSDGAFGETSNEG